MDKYSGKYFTQNHSITSTANSQSGKNAIQLMDNRPVSALQQKLSTIQKKTNSENNLSDENNLHTEGNQNPVQLQSTTRTVNNNSTIQLAKAKNPTRRNKVHDRVKKTKRFDINPLREYHDIKNNVSQKVTSTKLYLQKVEKQLDDDGDIALLGSYRNRLNKIYSDTKDLLNEIITLPPTKGRLRSQTVDRDKLASQLRGCQFYLHKVVTEIKKVFPMNAGGFGAKGRAHDMKAEVNPHAIPFGAPLNNHYFQNITLNGATPNVNVYKKSATVAKQKLGPLQVLGSTYPNNASVSKAVLLNNVDQSLGSINTPQDVTFRDTPVGKGRGDGQYKNMANTNAAGYAWLLGRVGNQRWEWLHIRGAGLGGKTDSTNLVAGARDANTHMIPFESNIRHLGTAVKNHPTKYSRLRVVWSVSGQVAKYAYKTIRIKWTLFRKDSSKKATGDVSFKPLDTANNISKNEVTKIENLLNDIRSGL